MKKVSELLSLRAWGLIWVPILAITTAHFLTSDELVWVHDILRRLYYIPIVLGAFGWGLHGALAASIASSIVYLPHAFQMFVHHFHHDPGGSTEKILEILLFNIIALIAGVLVERERRERRRQEEIARKLSETLDEMKLLDEQLIRTGRLQALGEMTAGLAHEIKNPLASIKGAAEIVADGIPADSPRRRMVDIQRAEIERLTALLERFLNFARPKDFVVAAVDIAALLTDTVAFIAPQAAKKNVRLETRFEPLTVPADREKLTQLLLNILLNAVDASPEGSTVTVSTEKRRKGKSDYACITVADRGAGIPAGSREKIFNPFFTTKPDGTGLGLSIAARIADQHKGFIEVDDAPEGGALFRVFLPL
ncbi:MAG TPA: ATP-binding protein [bacterium]|nr:ATP-binding protein [bacterium]